MTTFYISGYWKDDKTEFEDYIVSEFDGFSGDEETGIDGEGLTEDDYFFYGLSERDIQEAIKSGEDTCQDFVITSYTVRS